MDGSQPRTEQQPHRRAAAARGRLRGWLLAAIGLCYAVSIPWYRVPGEAPGLVGGLPDWVAVALGCYVAVAFLNACAWLVTPVPDAPDSGDSGA